MKEILAKNNEANTLTHVTINKSTGQEKLIKIAKRLLLEEMGFKDNEVITEYDLYTPKKNYRVDVVGIRKQGSKTFKVAIECGGLNSADRLITFKNHFDKVIWIPHVETTLPVDEVLKNKYKENIMNIEELKEKINTYREKNEQLLNKERKQNIALELLSYLLHDSYKGTKILFEGFLKEKKFYPFHYFLVFRINNPTNETTKIFNKGTDLGWCEFNKLKKNLKGEKINE